MSVVRVLWQGLQGNVIYSLLCNPWLVGVFLLGLISIDPSPAPSTPQIHGGRESRDIPRIGHWDGIVCNQNAEPIYPILYLPPIYNPYLGS